MPLPLFRTTICSLYLFRSAVSWVYLFRFIISRLYLCRIIINLLYLFKIFINWLYFCRTIIHHLYFLNKLFNSGWKIIRLILKVLKRRRIKLLNIFNWMIYRSRLQALKDNWEWMRLMFTLMDILKLTDVNILWWRCYCR